MRYLVMKPNHPQPTDPRFMSIDSLAHLLLLFPPVIDTDDEEDARDHVRSMYPDAVVMPVPLKVGSGDLRVLGVLESIRHYNPDGASSQTDVKFPFVAFVYARAETKLDHQRVRLGAQWTEKLWRAPVMYPNSRIDWTTVELRTSELPNPVRLPCELGRAEDGRLVLRIECGAWSLSIAFDPKDEHKLDVRPAGANNVAHPYPGALIDRSDGHPCRRCGIEIGACACPASEGDDTHVVDVGDHAHD